jgi:hypothetical protein
MTANLPIKMFSGGRIPARAHDDDAALDCYAAIRMHDCAKRGSAGAAGWRSLAKPAVKHASRVRPTTRSGNAMSAWLPVYAHRGDAARKRRPESASARRISPRMWLTSQPIGDVSWKLAYAVTVDAHGARSTGIQRARCILSVRGTGN